MRKIDWLLILVLVGAATKALLLLLSGPDTAATAAEPCAEKMVTLDPRGGSTVTVTPTTGGCIYITGIYIKQ